MDVSFFSDDLVGAAEKQWRLYGERVHDRPPHISLKKLFSLSEIPKDLHPSYYCPFFMWVDACLMTSKAFNCYRYQVDREDTDVKENCLRLGYEKDHFGHLDKSVRHFLKRVLTRVLSYLHEPELCLKKCTQDLFLSEVCAEKVVFLVTEMFDVLLEKKIIKKYEWYTICFVPTVLWLVVCGTDLKENTFFEGLELIQNEIANGGLQVKDEDLCALLEIDVQPTSSCNATSVPESHTCLENCLIEKSLLPNGRTPFTKIVLPTPKSVVVKKRWNDVIRAGTAVSTALKAMTKDYSNDGETTFFYDAHQHGLALNTGTGEALSMSRCGMASWRDLCGLHLWPCTSLALTARPSWTEPRKKTFLFTIMYMHGVNEGIVDMVKKDPDWGIHLPFLDSTFCYQYLSPLKPKILIPLKKGRDDTCFEIFIDLTCSLPHQIMADTEALITLMCAKRYVDCFLSVLTDAFENIETRAHAEQLHPLLNKNTFTWLKFDCAFMGEKETKEEALFRLTKTEALVGRQKILSFYSKTMSRV